MLDIDKCWTLNILLRLSVCIGANCGFSILLRVLIKWRVKGIFGIILFFFNCKIMYKSFEIRQYIKGSHELGYEQIIWDYQLT